MRDPKNGDTGDTCAEASKSGDHSAIPTVGNAFGCLSPGLFVLRDGILAMATTHCMSLKETRHHAAAGVHRAKDSTQEEVNRLRFVTSKVAEHQSIYDRALAEYEKAEDVLKTARSDSSTVTNREEKLKKNNHLKSCEALVKSWAKNLDTARERLAFWEFKNTRQVELVGKLSDAAHAADLNYRRTCDMIDSDIGKVEALAEFLSSTRS